MLAKNNQAVIDRTSTNGMEDAVIEMLCLALCEKIYGSYGSTFSNVASYIFGTPKITVGQADN